MNNQKPTQKQLDFIKKLRYKVKQQNAIDERLMIEIEAPQSIKGASKQIDALKDMAAIGIYEYCASNHAIVKDALGNRIVSIIFL